MGESRSEDRPIVHEPLSSSDAPLRPELETETSDDDITPSPDEQTDPDRGTREMGTEGMAPMKPLPRPAR